MSYSLVRQKSLAVKLLRANAAVAEAELRMELAAELSRNRGAALRVARHCGVSTQHVSDIRHGRRGFSDEIVERLGRLK